jgi:hypothetical protein
MKIKNITKDTNHSQEIVIPILIRGGEGINVTLKPGDFVFVEELNNNMTVRVYQQKQFLDITFDDKSENYDFYKVYEKEHSEISFTDEQKRELISNSKVVLDDISSIFSEEEIEELIFEGTTKEELFIVEEEKAIENSEIEVEIVVPEGSIINKGGRPLGVKNKPKKGKAKSKAKARKRKPATKKK